jgi:uncharacterized BrkB/YihY/UPF0761 family membrane protein
VARGTAVPLNRIERILAFMLGAVVVLTIASVVAIFIGGAAGAAETGGIWPVLRLLPAIGLPIALVLAIVLIIVMGVRRRRLAADDAGK